VGGWGGFKSAILVFPDRKLSIAVLSNWDYMFHNPKDTAEMLAGLLLAPAAPATPAAAEASAGPREVRVEPQLLDAYVGDYRLTPGDLVTILREGEQLVLVADGNMRFPLSAPRPRSSSSKSSPSR